MVVKDSGEENGATKDVGAEVTANVVTAAYLSCGEALERAEEILAHIGDLPHAPNYLVRLSPSSDDAVRTKLAAGADGGELVGAAVLSEALYEAEAMLNFAEVRRGMALHAALETASRMELRSAELRATVHAGRRLLAATLATALEGQL